MSAEPVVVTGAGGFLGRTLVARLQQIGVPVVAVTRRRADFGSGVTVAAAEPTNASSLEVPFSGASAVFHLVAHTHDATTFDDSDAQRTVTLGSTIAALEASARREVRYFIFVSSLAVYGPMGSDPVEEGTVCRPDTPYGRAKLEAENAVRDFSRRHGVRAVILRPAMMYGVGCPGNLTRMVRAIRERRFPPLPDFHNPRSIVSVRDAADAVIRAWRADISGARAFNIADDSPRSPRQMQDAIRRALGRAPLRHSLPGLSLRVAATAGDGLRILFGRRVGFDSGVLMRLSAPAVCSTNRAKKELGFLPSDRLDDMLPAIVAALSDRVV